MVANIVKRLKDPDSNIRDACVESMGVLASQIGGAGPGAATTVFVKPLLEALGEQNKTLQIGAAMCLARVVECVKDPHPPTLQRLCPRMVKMLASPNFLAKSSLLSVVGVMVQVPGVVSTSQLPVLLGAVQEELDNNEWAVRKAASEVLSCMATSVGNTLVSYREGVLTALMNSRFDKVKPVRDSVTEALLLWKAIYDPNAAQSTSPKGSHGSLSPTRRPEGDSTPTMTDRKNSLLGKSGESVTSSFSDSSGRPKSMPDKRAGLLKKRAPALSDKKPNPDFFRKLEGVRDSMDWQIEVAVPRDPPQEDNPKAVATSSQHLVYCGNRSETKQGSVSLGSAYASGGMLTPDESNGTDLHYNQEEGGLLKQSAGNRIITSNCYQDPNSKMLQERLEKSERWGDSQINEHQNHGYNSSWDGNDSTITGIDKGTADMGSVHRHLTSLERQQLSMMEMLQDSMVRVHESMQDLEGRVSRLEQIVEDLAHSSSNTDGRSPVGELPTFQDGHPLGKYLSGNGFLNFKSGKTPEDTSAPLSARSRDSMEKTESISGESDEFAFGSGQQMPAAEALRRSQVMGPRPLQKGNKADREIDQDVIGTRRACDPSPDVLPQGEGPSARSVWQASKDEAIAAIRGAAIPSKPRDSHRHQSNRDFNVEQKSNRVVSGPFWMLWSRAMESARAGELDVAYADIIGSNDELLLVRLMGRTGPVMEQLSDSTVTHLICSIKQFLQQQSFLDCIIPWIQQVLDLVSSNGPDALGLSGDTKKDLVFALQEATTKEYAESWMASKIAELAEQMGSIWSSSGNSVTGDS